METLFLFPPYSVSDLYENITKSQWQLEKNMNLKEQLNRIEG